MPWQLIYTSAPRGLVSGQSGFCTVARSADLRDALAQRLEQISSYHYLEIPGASNGSHNPVISAYRVLDVRGAKYHVLSRIRPCGLDFTARTNHVAQHVVFQPDELAQQQSPAAILRHWKGWLSSWTGEPRVLEPTPLDSFKALPAPSWPAKEWLRLTGDAGRAAALLEGDCARGCYLLCPAGGEDELLDLLCETLQLPNYTGKYPLRAWQHPFTTFLQAEDAAGDFHWRGCQAGSPAYRQAVNRSAAILQLRNLRVPNNLSAKLAREGLPTPRSSTPPQAPPPGLKVRKEPGTPPIPPPASIDFSKTEFRSQGGRPAPSVGRTITIKKTSLQAIAIALALLAGVFVLRHSHHPSDGTAPAPPETPNSSPGPRAPTATSPSRPDTANNVQSRPVRADPDQLKRELSGALKEMRTFLVVQTALPSTNSIMIEGIGPLGGLLRNFNQYKLLPKDVEAELSFDGWGCDGGKRLQLDYSLRGGGGTLSGTDNAGQTITLDHSDLGNAQPLGLRTQFNLAPRAFSLIFRPAQNGAKLFEAFRLLVVNEGNSPPALQLDNHFLFERWSRPGALGMIEEPLASRLKWTWPMATDDREAAWQLLPFVKTKDSTGVRNLWRDVLRRTPEHGKELDFIALRKSLTGELDDLTTQAAMLDKQLGDLAAHAPTNVDLALPLGEWLGLTNADLLSFAAYTNNHAATLSSSLFRTYLRSVTEKARGQNNWLPKTSSEHWLDELYEKCKKHFPNDKSERLTLNGPVTNYFVAVEQSIEDAHSQRGLLAQKKDVDLRLEQIRGQLASVPSSWDETAYLTLNLLAPDRPLEVIRFSDFSTNH